MALQTRVTVYLDGAQVSQQVPTDTVIPYISDTNSVRMTTGRGREIALALEPVEWNSPVSVTYKDANYQGKLIKLDAERVTLELDTGSGLVVLTTRYDSIRYQQSMRYPESYIVAYHHTGSSTPTLHYRTESLYWISNLSLDITNGIMDLTAMIHSRREAAFRAEFTVATYGGRTHEKMYAPRSQMMAAASSAEPVADSSHFFTYQIGQDELVMGRALRYPLLTKSAYPDKYALIDLSLGTDQGYQPAVVAYSLKAPFQFPDSNLTIIDGDYVANQSISSHRTGEFMIVRTYESPTLGYRAASSLLVTETAGTSAPEVSRLHQLTIELRLNKTNDDEEKMMIMYRLAGVQIERVEPTPITNIELPGYIIWITRITANCNITLKIAYLA